ncbi:MAG TPA: Hpt domain-containing protein, partial [Longimicrobiales bacterium]|nr:Hpt domain-containing protein [Longimicrobiales bacterium]
MVRLFLVTSEEARLRIDAALANGHAHVAQAAAHHLFSSAAQLRLGVIAELAERVETAARAGDLTAAQTLATEMTAGLAAAAVELRQFLAELPGAASVVVVD